jgi:NAD(P)-dependent dehydrogenase (short-subunit alcohol dehydrogenase family)
MDLRGRVAVVTGGASGIGAAVASELKARGAIPVVWDINDGDVGCDVADPGSVETAMKETVDRFGTPTLLLANAGVRGAGRIVDLDCETWDRTFSVNVRGVFLSLQAVARSMIDAELTGAVVLTASVAGVLADPGVAAYSSSKAAVMHLARVAARELGANGIRVNAVAPGPTDTPMIASGKQVPGWTDAILAATPLGRLGRPADISAAVVALMELEWVTGQVLLVDGGEALSTARGMTVEARATSSQ